MTDLAQLATEITPGRWELLAEVLRLREELQSLRKEYNGHLFEQIASQDESNKQLDVIESRVAAALDDNKRLRTKMTGLKAATTQLDESLEDAYSESLDLTHLRTFARIIRANLKA